MRISPPYKLFGIFLCLLFVVTPMPIYAIAQTVTETCTLSCHVHPLAHTFSSSLSPGKYYCTVCGIAYKNVVMQEFHPEGAPAGVTSTRPVVTVVNASEGLSTESCSITGCILKGPHSICACGYVSGPAPETHTRTYANPNLTYEKLRGFGRPYVVDNAHAGDVIVVPSNGSYDTVLSIYMNDTLVNTINNSYGGTYVVPYDGALRVEEYAQSENYAYYLCNIDSDGTKWNVPIVYGGISGGGISYTQTYGDGITMHGSCRISFDDYSHAGKVTFCNNEYLSYRFKLHLEKGQIVTMTCGNTTHRYDNFANLVLADTSLNIIAETDVSKASEGTVKAVTAPSSGDYWVFPCYYWEYDSSFNGTYGSGNVTVRTANAVAPAIAITVTPTTLTLEKGQSSTVTAAATPSTATVTYSSNNSAVASVTNAGGVTAAGVGSCTITATATT